LPAETLASRYEQITCLTEPSGFVTTRQSLLAPEVLAGAVAQPASTITSDKKWNLLIIPPGVMGTHRWRDPRARL